MASAPPWSMRCQRAARPAHLAQRQGILHALPPRRAGEGPASWWATRRTGKRGTEVTFLPSKETFTKTEFDFATLEHRLRELAFLNSGVRIVLSDERGAEPKVSELYYEGGVEAFAKYLDRNKAVLHNPPVSITRRARRHDRRSRHAVERQLSRDDAVLHQQHPAARRRHASRRLPRRADPHAEQIRRRGRHVEEGEGHAHRRGHARGPDLRAVGQGARPEVLLADQGQAGLLGGPAGGGIGGERQARPVVRGASRRRRARSSPRWSRPRPPARPPARRAS